MQYPYPPYYPEPPSPRRRKVDRRLIGALAFLGVMLAVAVGVAVDHALTRISDQVLTVILTIGCAAGLGLPATLLALVVLIRRAENGNERKHRQPQVMTTPPQVVVIPPMQIPPQQAQLPPYQGPAPGCAGGPATWEQVPARHFTVVGEE